MMSPGPARALPRRGAAHPGRSAGAAPLPARHRLSIKWSRDEGPASPSRPRPQGRSVMGFRAVFIAVVLGTALIVAAYLINGARPREVTEVSSADLVRASGKCAECHI